MRFVKMIPALLLAVTATPAVLAASPNCAVEGGTLMSWPASEPLWEMCWLPPNDSIGPRGSGLELRAVHYRGIQVARRTVAKYREALKIAPANLRRAL